MIGHTRLAKARYHEAGEERQEARPACTIPGTIFAPRQHNCRPWCNIDVIIAMQSQRTAAKTRRERGGVGGVTDQEGMGDMEMVQGRASGNQGLQVPSMRTQLQGMQPAVDIAMVKMSMGAEGKC